MYKNCATNIFASSKERQEADIAECGDGRQIEKIPCGAPIRIPFRYLQILFFARDYHACNEIWQLQCDPTDWKT